MPPNSNDAGGAGNAQVQSSEKTQGSEHVMDPDIFHGDLKLKKQVNLNDFIHSATDEPHASRRKEMIKKYPEIKELMGHEWRTKYIVLVVMALHMAVGYYLRDEAFTMKFWLTSYVVGGTLVQILFLANHEISHNLAFKKFHHNKLFGIFTNLTLLIPYFMYFKQYHNEHHKYQGVVGVDTDLPTKLEARLLSSTPGKFFYMFNQVWFYAFRPPFIRKAQVNRYVILNYIVEGCFVAAVYNTFGSGPLWYFLASAHWAGSIHPLASHFIAEHFTFVGEAETMSYYGNLNYLTWNVGYHNEHHDFPTVAWSNLPKLREIGKEYYEDLPYHKSWTLALAQFLLNPGVTMYNRVIREDKYGQTDSAKAAQAGEKVKAN